MTDSNNVFRPAKDRRKKAPVKRVALSPEAKAAYEASVKERDERHRTYGQHLDPNNKSK